MNEALRDWVTNVDDTYLPHRHGRRPASLSGHGARLPVGHRRARCASRSIEAEGRLPDTLVACVGGGSNAIGLFHPFLDDPRREDLRRRGRPATGSRPARHAASMTGGRPGVLHGNRTYLLQDDDGQIIEAIRSPPASIIPASARSTPGCTTSAGSNYVSATDDEALDAFQLLLAARGHHPGAGSRPRPGPRDQDRPEPWPKDHIVVMNLSGRGDKDVFTVAEHLGHARSDDELDAASTRRFAELKRGRAAPASSPLSSAGDPDSATSLAILQALPAAGADMIELGMPFSDPMADGPAIQAAAPAGAEGRHDAGDTLAAGRATSAPATTTTPIVLMGYYNPIYTYGVDRFLARRQGRRRRRADRRRPAAGRGRRALPAGARAPASTSSAWPPRPPTTGACPTVLQQHLAASSTTSRSPASPAPAPPTPSEVARGGRRASSATPACRSRSASASRRPSRRRS